MTAGWAEGLGTLAGAASFPLVTSLVIKGGFACLDAWLGAAPFSLEVSLGRGKGLAGPCNFSLVAYFPLSTVSARIGSLGGSEVAGKVPTGAAWPNSGTWRAMSTRELGGLAIREVRG